LRVEAGRQAKMRVEAGPRWREHNLVFSTRFGTELDAANVRRAFRTVADAAGLVAAEWTPRELRHSFVSLLSSSGMPIEDISHLVGHASTNVTEKVYRKELRPVLMRGAEVMDRLFVVGGDQSLAPQLAPQPVILRKEDAAAGGDSLPEQGWCWWAILGSNQW
jgi:integrase